MEFALTVFIAMGAGGGGGRGGNAGNITIYFYNHPDLSINVPTFLRLNANAGMGGKGGEGGPPGHSGTESLLSLILSASFGRGHSQDGESGKDGRPGSVNIFQITEAKKNNFFNKISHPDFDRNKIFE